MSQGGHTCGRYMIAAAASVSNLELNKSLKTDNCNCMDDEMSINNQTIDSSGSVTGK